MGLLDHANKRIDEEIIRWNNIPTPQVRTVNVPPIEATDFENFNRTIPTFIASVDEQNYFYLSQTELGEHVYKASVFVVSYFVNIF